MPTCSPQFFHQTPMSACCTYECCVKHSFELFRNYNFLTVMITCEILYFSWTTSNLSSNTVQHLQVCWKHCTCMCCPAPTAQQLCFLSCATSSTAALQLRGNCSAARSGSTAMLITLQMQKEGGRKAKREGKRESSAFIKEGSSWRITHTWLRNRENC